MSGLDLKLGRLCSVDTLKTNSKVVMCWNFRCDLPRWLVIPAGLALGVFILPPTSYLSVPLTKLILRLVLGSHATVSAMQQ